jgi:hypothetical protein
MLSAIIAVLVAALVYFLCITLGLPSIVAIIAAILVLVAGISSGSLGARRTRL